MKKCVAACVAAVFLASGFAGCGTSGATGGRKASQAESPVQSASAHEDTASSQQSRREESMPYAVDLQVVRIPAPSLSQNLIEEPDMREISILLPQSYYHSEDAYPVVYFLNGYGSAHGNSARLAYNAMTALSAELIVVCVDAVNRLGCSYYVNSPVTGNWQDFVTADAVSYVDQHYRTVAQASGRGLAGHSIGGFGALNIALDTEGIFSHVYAMSPAVLAPDGLLAYGLQFDTLSRSIQEYDGLSEVEARAQYLGKLGDTSWRMRFTFDYGSAFVYDATGKAPYIRIPERIAEGEYLKDAVWERYQSGLGGPPQRIGEERNRLLKLSGLVVEYGNSDELTWVLEGCEYLVRQLNTHAVPFDLRIYDGDHTSEIPARLVSDVLPYFTQNLAG